jgi:hypothetical protein
MDDNDFVMDALFAEVKRLNADLQEEDANETTERNETMESKEERLLKAIFSEKDDADDNYPETYAEKAGYAEYALTHTLQDISAALWRLSRLDRLLFAAEKDGENTLPDIITNNEVRMALTPLLRVENDVSEITEMLAEIYYETKAPEAPKEADNAE